MQKSKQKQRSPDKEGNYFESAALIRFEKIYFIFMAVCFKSFDESHRSDVVWVILTWRVNYEEQLLRVFLCLYFETKCNDHKKRFISFSLTITFSAFKSMYNNINRII